MGSQRIRTTQEYIAHVTKKWEGISKFEYLNTVFTGQDKLIEFYCCNCNRIITDMTAKAHREKGCKYCNGYSKPRTKDEVIKESIEIHGNAYDFSFLTDENYPCNKPFELKCKKHGIIFQTNVSKLILAKHGCQKCGEEKQVISRTKPQSQFIEEAISKWGTMHDYSQITYVNNHTDIEYFCYYSGMFVTQTPKSHLLNGCTHCSGFIRKHTWESYIKVANIKHNNEYTYPMNGDFPGVNHEINIRCDKHGIFKQHAGNHLHGSGTGNGCSECHGGIALTHEEFLKRANDKHKNKFIYPEEYKNMFSYITVICPKHKETKQRACDHLSSIYGCSFCARESQRSIGEQEICDYIKSIYDGEMLTNNNSILENNKHLDIYLPEKKLAIEYNGLYWHREEVVGKNYHLNKTNECESKGIRLIHVWDKEWEVKKEIVKSKISSLLNKNNRIIARKTKVISLTYDQKNQFLNETHIQGEDTSQIYLGLIYENEIVACMTFGTPRFNNNYDWELIRFSTKLFTTVVGGGSKLLAHFIKNSKGSIISYADRRWSVGKLYENLGFQLNLDDQPGFDYYDTNKHALHSRFKFQKHKLVDMPFYDSDKTEYEIMLKNGYDRVWNSGQLRYILEN